MNDLTTISRKYGLPRAQDGDALQLPSGCKLVRWESRLAVYSLDAQLIRRIARQVRGAKVEHASAQGATATFPTHALSGVLNTLERAAA